MDGIQELIDREAEGIRQELEAGGREFAMRLVTELFTHARQALGSGLTPALRPPASTGDPKVDVLILAGVRWAMRSQSDLPWPAPVPLPALWHPYSFRPMTARLLE